MKSEFRLILDIDGEMTLQQADALAGAGLNDSTICANYVVVDVRDGSLEQLVREAISQVNSAGLSVLRVEIPGYATVEEINKELSQT